MVRIGLSFVVISCLVGVVFATGPCLSDFANRFFSSIRHSMGGDRHLARNPLEEDAGKFIMTSAPSPSQLKAGRAALRSWPSAKTSQERSRLADLIVVGRALEGSTRSGVLKLLGAEYDGPFAYHQPQGGMIYDVTDD
ncbi:MAG: hypothetical protein KC777_09475, partial [Cyanobacteria bacterium HKST-UBA02]|nr:hypothetical protein [Cyanobacteria bacterium HKST-UBA02]